VSRNRQSAKKAGASFERSVADHLAQELDDDRIDRRVKHGAKDRGDIGGVRTMRGGRVVIEVKNVSRDSLPAWIKEAEIERQNDEAAIGVVVHKKHGSAKPGEQYVSMTLDTFVKLLKCEPQPAWTVEQAPEVAHGGREESQ
jgi:hypothetical protein